MYHLIRLTKQIRQHPANRGRRLRAILDSLKWQLNKQLLPTETVIDYHGLKFICFKDSHSSSAVIYFNGLPDFNEMRFMKSYLKPGDAFLDIGANIGTYSLYAASLVGPAGLVEAFEAVPRTADKLARQIELNRLKHIRLHRVAVSDYSGEVRFESTREDCTAHISVQPDNLAHQFKVKAVSLDSYLDPAQPYALGKMDIEGAEILALKGAERLLVRANPPVWQLELAGYSNRYGYRSDQVRDYLNSFDFRCAVYDGAANDLVYIDKPWKSGYQNVFFIHPSAALFQI